jgi:ABC-type amino acid transport substrate-binding protein
MKRVHAIIAFLLMVFINHGFSKDWKTIRIGTEPDYSPFESKAADGSLIGFEIDLGNALAQKMGAKVDWVQTDFDGLIPSLQARKIDAIMSSMTSTEKRRRQIAFSDKLFGTPSRLIAKTGSPLLLTADSLKGKKIGVQAGTNADTYAKKVLRF